MRGLVHCHTYFSFDSLLPPAVYIWYANRCGLDFLCITDHNTLAGARAAARLNRNKRLQVVIGAEYATDQGDIIGLFLHEEIRERACQTVIRAIHAQGGLAILPHPYRGHQLDEELWAAVDLVEVFNARSSAVANGRGQEQAQLRCKPQLVGADTHTFLELIRNRTFVAFEGHDELRERFLEASRSFTTRSSSRLLRRYSQVVKRARQRVGLSGYR
jgi:predicted metal-dependent phosphoesterase TrpH